MTRRSLSAGNLPADATVFVGRRRLLEAASSALDQSRLVTLAGSGGVGKTRAAIHLGRLHARANPGGVWLVDLATVDDPELVPHAVANALGIHDQSQRPALDTIVDHVRERDHLLLILDNCEHLSTPVAELADTLLRHAPTVRILATSRQPLGVPGEHILPVPPMSLPARVELRACTSLDAIAHHDAVHLFLDRAADAGIVVSDQDAATVDRLVRALEGIPLSIELAAARTITMSVADILDRLHDPLHVLTGTSRIAHPAHHHDVDATLGWSYQLCTPNEQLLWAKLSVFTGGFDLAAAEAVCADDRIPAAQILTVIDGLTRQSLIAVHRTGTNTRIRYRMLETVRAYGLARLTAASQEADLRRRHRDYYRTLTDTAATDWHSTRELDWMNRIRQDMPNIRAALGSAVAAHDTNTGLITAVNLSRSRAWFFAGTQSEARYWLRTLLAQQPDTPLRLLVLTTGAWIAACQGDKCSALSIIADCLRTTLANATTTTTDGLDAAMIAYAKGAYQLFCGSDFAGAEASFTRARDGLLHAGLFSDAHMARLCLATAAAAGSDPDAAFTAAEDCLTDAQTVGAQWATSWAQWALGLTHLRHGDPRRALALLRTGLRTQQATGDNWGPPWSLAALGWTAAALGDHAQAALLMGAAHRQYQRIGLDTTGMKLLARLGAASETATRDALGTQPYTAACQHGTELDYATAITTALAQHNPTPQHPHREHPTGNNSDTATQTMLTDREEEVAHLLGSDASMTNKDMANHLYISVRTVDTHINHIMHKLGVNTRAQIAVWASTHTSPSR
ncbi:MAG TPA: LuxR C-terminal-related transcriptional regulator [Pseudonocardiaceae bacterium]|jgi:predicted ATPase/DNA-binding CsgD family transcriptional regulator|nr:LuxR C-terminal-related transcriptional regulator [Pseudonocardiaceae bacterium]